MATTVAVLGGGVGGLSAAHELAERGFSVTVYEKRALPGGKARSYPTPSGLPAEHGFRFFPAFYRHLPDTMARIPSGNGSARDRLVGAGFPLLAADDVAEAVWVALTSGETGHAWVVQPGRPPLDFRFPTLPGPRGSDEERVGAPPPLT